MINLLLRIQSLLFQFLNHPSDFFRLCHLLFVFLFSFPFFLLTELLFGIVFFLNFFEVLYVGLNCLKLVFYHLDLMLIVFILFLDVILELVNLSLKHF